MSPQPYILHQWSVLRARLPMPRRSGIGDGAALRELVGAPGRPIGAGDAT